MNTHKFHLWPQEKYGLPCIDFHPHQIINVASTETNSFTPLSRAWLSLHWFPGELSLSTPSQTFPASIFFSNWMKNRDRQNFTDASNLHMTFTAPIFRNPKITQRLKWRSVEHFRQIGHKIWKVLVNIHLHPEVRLSMRHFHETTLA